MSKKPNPSDAEYFTQRAADEMARAEACKDEQIAAIHRELAERYEKLASLSQREPLAECGTDCA